MGETGKIRGAFDVMKANYPTYDKLPPDLQTYMDRLNAPYVHKSGPLEGQNVSDNNTPCCIQVSHALNKAGLIVPASSFWRANAPIGSFYYLQAVNELEQYLSGRYGRGEDVRKVGDTKAIKQHLDGLQGILVFRSAGAGFHTELWDEDHILQDGSTSPGAVMDQGACFGQPRVLFYEVDDDDNPYENPAPDWLQGWWEVYDGNTYYYYFSDQNVATYTKTKPANLKSPPVRVPMNEGDVSVSDNGLTVEIDWNPADGGETIETFKRQSASTTFMNGTSNRYAPLTATKM